MITTGGAGSPAAVRSARGVLVALGLTACNAAGPAALGTGLTGTVERSPVTPVCQVNVPCSAPFSARFTILQGPRLVAAFSSDSQGHFTVPLEPGPYQLVPGSDAPIISPQSQAKSVVVGPSGLTPVRLEFDTGLR